MRNIAFGYSTRCNIRCDHCVAADESVSESKMNLQTALHIIDQMSEAGVTGISFTAGEPFLYFEDILQLVARCNSHNIYTRVVTNSFWANDNESAIRHLSALKNAGVSQLRLSFSRWHQQHVARENVLNAALGCKALDINCFVSFVTDFKEIDNEYENYLYEHKLKFFPEPLIYAGRAKHYLKEPISHDYADNRCAMNCYLAPDLAMYACCDAGSQFTRTNALLLGNLKESDPSELFEKTEKDPLFHCIRTLGLSAIATYMGLGSREIIKYRKCELCEKLLNDSAMLQNLRKNALTGLPAYHR